MRRPDRHGYRMIGVVAILIALVCIAAMVYSDSRVSGSVVARPLGWLASGIAISAIAAAAGLLLSQRGADHEGRRGFGGTRCPSCDHEVLGQWRMCPYCGAMLSRPGTSAVPGSSSIDQ